MNRTEALRMLGLDEGATDEDIKTAYREMAQILHPDRFASNKKLQDRATEQFKNLQQAYDHLTKHGRADGSSRSGARPHTSSVEAKLAGIQAARTELTRQKDLVLDERRNGVVMLVAGGLIAFVLRRLIPVASIASAVAVWGVVQVISSQRTVDTIDEHLARLKKEQSELESQLG